MMELLAALFGWLDSMLKLQPAVVLSASFLWGILSVILSPCHLSSIPLAVGYINGKGKMKTSRALQLSVFFALGILISLTAIGIITSLFGRMLGDTGKITLIIIGAIFILVGISMLELIRLPEVPIWKAGIKRGSSFGALTLGLLFGAALGPCTFGFMMPVLGLAFQLASTRLWYAIAIMFAYAIGHALVIVFAGTFMNWVQKLLNWEEHSRGLLIFRRICGILIILTGLYLIISK